MRNFGMKSTLEGTTHRHIVHTDTDTKQTHIEILPKHKYRQDTHIVIDYNKMSTENTDTQIPSTQTKHLVIISKGVSVTWLPYFSERCLLFD